ncbi:hypothetical protein GPJ56_008335 [Histomonas meleagridis]|uniref:uncharacterized protein n=1 Tax=Histomonas meleagridis TaxID=135588 RepID=UPI00355A350C|nr:hypothetical protein GPJ56_008335 [Histomonas meleagridis]KAH0806906.1 hypothetical protein GO595_000082 [Histomonas meleagridis]
MDIEHSLSEEGINYGYQMTQNDETITVTTKYSPKFSGQGVIFEYLPEDNSLYLGFREQPPEICGRLYSGVNSAICNSTSTEIIVTLIKSSKNEWPFLISSPSAHGIDSKSLFLLGLHADSSKDYQTAWTNFFNSYKAGYYPAAILVADILMSSENPYSVKQDLDESIKILLNIFDETHKPQIAIKAASALKKRHRFMDARALLERCADQDDDAKLMLAKLLSPIFGELDEAQHAVSLFAALSSKKNPEAMRCLAKHMLTGSGIEKNKEEAKRLIEEAKSIDGVAAEIIQISDKWSHVLIGAAIGVGVAAVAFGIVALWRRRSGNK